MLTNDDPALTAFSVFVFAAAAIAFVVVSAWPERPSERDARELERAKKRSHHQ